MAGSTLKPVNWTVAQNLLNAAHDEHYPTKELCDFVSRCISANSEAQGKLLFLVAEYAYGDLLIDGGRFHYPTGLLPADIVNLSNITGIQDDSAYIPVGVVLSGTLEVSGSEHQEPLAYRHPENGVCEESVTNVYPITYMPPGYIFGTFEHFDRSTAFMRIPTLTVLPNEKVDISYDVSAGSRKVHLLFDKTYKPIEDFDCFRSLAREISFPSEWEWFDRNKKHFPDVKFIKSICKDAKWCCRVLLFSQEVFDGDTPHHHALREFVKDIGWHQARHMHRKYFDEIVQHELKTDKYHEFVKGKNPKKEYHEEIARILRTIPLVRANQTLALRPVLEKADSQYGPFFDFLTNLQNALDRYIADARREDRKIPRKCFTLLQYDSFQHFSEKKPLYLPVAGRIEIVREGPKGDMAKIINLFAQYLEKEEHARFISIFPRGRNDKYLARLARNFIAKEFLEKKRNASQDNLGDYLFLQDHLRFFKGFLEIRR